MKLLFEEYSGVIYEAIVSTFIYVFLVYSFLNTLLVTNTSYLQNVMTPAKTSSNHQPISIRTFEVNNALIDLDDEFDYQKYVKATDLRNEDISMYVTLLNKPDLEKVGKQELTYILRYNGEKRAIKANLIIVDKESELNQ